MARFHAQDDDAVGRLLRQRELAPGQVSFRFCCSPHSKCRCGWRWDAYPVSSTCHVAASGHRSRREGCTVRVVQPMPGGAAACGLSSSAAAAHHLWLAPRTAAAAAGGEARRVHWRRRGCCPSSKRLPHSLTIGGDGEW